MAEAGCKSGEPDGEFKEPPRVEFVVRKRKRNAHIRGRGALVVAGADTASVGSSDSAEEGADEGDSSAVVRVAKQAKKSALSFRSATREKTSQLQTPWDASHSASAMTETDESASVVPEPRKEKDPLAELGDVDTHDGKYHGLAAYHKYDPEKKFGPVAAPSNIRVTSRYDYQPDICKDYKETGYCGYGDACKFLHDRGDYKSGWELEQEWQQQRFGRGQEEERHEGDAASDEEEDDVPFACYLCRKQFTLESHPVVTRCEHYYCEACALRHYKRTPKCALCEEPTAGQFNVAVKVIQRLKRALQDGKDAE